MNLFEGVAGVEVDSLWRGTAGGCSSAAAASAQMAMAPSLAGPAGAWLCPADACTHAARSSPLDATVIQLSLHQPGPDSAI